MSTSVISVWDRITAGDPVVGHSPSIQRLNAAVQELAPTNIPVLLIGESGTGKEVYGRLIHRLSPHRERPLRKLNCRASDPVEFKGYLKAALGAVDRDPESRSLTLFMDGIDELELSCQKLLLSLLPDGHSDEDNRHGVRLIASTCQDLEKESQLGSFRRELYFRISGVSVHLPPLRERTEDIPELLDYFLAKYATELRRDVPVVGDPELDFLQAHNWPGNIRELENLARKIVVLGHSRKAIDELRGKPKPQQISPHQATSLKVAARAASREAERELISKALERTHWNRKRAARDLQISYKSLLYKIKQIGLDGAPKEMVKETQ
jgi:two-component system, NtrC family, response regulator AtoC